MCSFAVALSAPAAKAAEPVIPAGDLARFSVVCEKAGDGTAELVPVTGMPFDKAWRIRTVRQPAETWKLRIHTTSTAPVARGDTLWIRFFLRGLESRNETGEGQATFVFETASPDHDKSVDVTVGAGNEWREIVYPFLCRHDLAAGEAMLSFRAGFRPQLIEIGGIELRNYRRMKTVAELPRTRVDYAGREPDAAWRKAAAARIEKLRKGDIAVIVQDREGRPVPGARVELEQERHAFGFGSAIDSRFLTGRGPDCDRYRATVEKYFSKVVFENELKWGPWEEGKDRGRASTLAAIRWLEERGIAMRGHVLVWPSWGNMAGDVQGLRNDPEALRRRIAGRIAEVMGATRGKFTDWDVINEPYAHHDAMKVLGDGAMVEWFRLARAADPRPVLFLNDYAGLATGGMNTVHKDHFEKTARFLKDQGAPIGGLGLQCHFGWTVTPPDKALAELDRWHALGLTVHLTEFDLETTDEELQADYTRDLLTVAFSHPGVSSVMTWGFWEGRHWRPDAALWRKDWSLKPNGNVWTDLTRGAWWTKAAGATDGEGRWTARGFLGDYTATVRAGDRATTTRVSAREPSRTVRVTLP